MRLAVQAIPLLATPPILAALVVPVSILSILWARLAERTQGYVILWKCAMAPVRAAQATWDQPMMRLAGSSIAMV